MEEACMFMSGSCWGALILTRSTGVQKYRLFEETDHVSPFHPRHDPRLSDEHLRSIIEHLDEDETLVLEIGDAESPTLVYYFRCDGSRTRYTSCTN